MSHANGEGLDFYNKALQPSFKLEEITYPYGHDFQDASWKWRNGYQVQYEKHFLKFSMIMRNKYSS